jgi:hypothetical protein
MDPAKDRGQARRPRRIPRLSGRPRDNVRRARFRLALIVTGGNATEAARQAGYHPDHGRRLTSRDVAFRHLTERLVGEVKSEIAAWEELGERARGVINDALSAAHADGNVLWQIRLKAAIYAVDRVEGKPTVKVDQGKPEVERGLPSVALRFAVNAVLQQAVTMSDALRFAEENPDLVREWAERQGLL